MKLIKNDKLECQIADVAEVAGYLWQRGWAERNGGNISVNVTDLLTDEEKALPAISERYPLPKVMNALKGNFFLVTGTNRRMRYVASHPMENMAVIRISDTGDWYEIIADNPVRPTSELPSHDPDRRRVRLHCHAREGRHGHLLHQKRRGVPLAARQEF